jgi:hypothetical protein
MRTQSVSSAVRALALCLAVSSGCSERSLGDARRDNAINAVVPAPASAGPAPAAPVISPPGPAGSSGPVVTPPAPPGPGGSLPPPPPPIGQPPPPPPVIGGDIFVPGGRCEPECQRLDVWWSTASLRALNCTPGKPAQCTRKARISLSCSSTKRWVNESEELSNVAEFYRSFCGGCFASAPPGAQSCPEPDSPDPAPGACHPIPGTSVGRCDVTCAADVQMDMPCAPQWDNCSRPDGKKCACLFDKWYCLDISPP